MTKQILLRFLVLLFLNTTVFSQDQRLLDSLVQESGSATDSVRFKAFSFLAWNLKEKDKKEALRYANLLLEQATKKDNKRWIARGLSDLSVIYEHIGDTKKAMEYAEKAVPAAREGGIKKDLAGALLNLSNLRFENNQLSEALELQLQALKLYEELKKEYYIAVTCNAIGMSYGNIGNFKVSNTYLGRAYAISQKRGDLYLESISLGAMADNYRNLKQVDSSLILYKRVKQLFRQMEDYYNYATACNNLGELYFQTGNNRAGLAEYKEALESARTMQDTGSIATYEANVAKALVKEGKYAEAEPLLLDALATAHKLSNKEAELITTENLIGLFVHKKDPEKAELYLKQYNALRDSAFSKTMAKSFSEAQTKFDVEKKDLEIARNKAELKVKDEQALIRNGIIIGVTLLLLLLILLGVLFYRKKQVEQKASLDAEIARQKDLRTKSIIETEEKERIRIAKDLHDGIGQLLSAARMNLSSLESKIEVKSPDQQSALKNAVDLLDESVKEVRTVSHNMMPNVLLKLGLASAVKEFITKIQNTPDLKVNLEIVGMSERLEQEMESILYRVIQEVVSNIIRHAKASELGLQLIRHEKELSIIIEDNGIGFDSSKINDFSGIGLKNIISRVEFINGKVHFDSTPGKGTTVVVDVPLG